MTDLPGMALTGVSGRMGQMLVETIMASPAARLIGALERPGHDWIGCDLGEAMGGATLGVKVSDDPLEVISQAHGVLDFTTPSATVTFAALAAQARCVHVIGTTGMTENDLAKIKFKSGPI